MVQRIPVGVAVLILLGGAARGDDLIAKQGGRPIVTNVKVVEEAGGKIYYLDKSLKRRSFPASVIGRIVRKPSDVHAYLERYEAARDADAVMALASWAKDRKFRPDVIRRLWERALELDSRHEAANRALGRVLHDGEWMTPEEKERRLKEAEEAAMRAKGLVRWNDEWVTPEDKEKLERGLRKYKGRWLTEDEIKEEQGFVRFGGKWVKRDELEVIELTATARKETGLGARLQVVQTPHYAVLGDLAPAQLQQLAQTMERLYAEWVRLFPDSESMNLLEGKHRMFVFRKPPPYQKFVRARFKRQKAEEGWSDRFAKQEERRMKLRLRETSFWDVQPHVESAHVQMPDPFEALRSHCVHFGANALATRYARLRFPTWWLNESIAYYFEKKVTGAIQTYSADTGGAGVYADQGPAENNKANPWLDATKWNDMLLALVRGNRDPRLQRMKSRNLYEPKNRLRAPDLAKGLSVVTFLVREDAKKFAAFFRACKEGGSTDPIEREVSAVLEHYGNYGEIEKRWKQFALNGFRLAR